MKQSTVNRIISNHSRGKSTYIGVYAYNLKWNPMAGKYFIIRCKREDEGREWLNWEGNIISGWEWTQSIDF